MPASAARRRLYGVVRAQAPRTDPRNQTGGITLATIGLFFPSWLFVSVPCGIAAGMVIRRQERVEAERIRVWRELVG
jgi:hypothetical protein